MSFSPPDEPDGPAPVTGEDLNRILAAIDHAIDEATALNKSYHIKLIQSVIDSLPRDHHEIPGLIRAKEIITYG